MKVDDDEQLEAHKVILSAASPFFQNILERNHHSHPLLYIRGSSKKNLSALLDFMYSGEARVPIDELERFMSLAEDLKVSGLVGELPDNQKYTHNEGIEPVDGKRGQQVPK